MQIAVARADQPTISSGIEPFRVAIDRRPGVRRQTLAGGFVQNGGALFGKAQRVAVDDPRHAVASATIRTPLCARVQAHDRVGQALHQPGIQSMALGETVEEGVLIEPHHLDDPIDRLALPSQRQGAAGLACDRPYAEVEGRAVRRFKRTSASQATRLSSIVEKST